MPIDYDRPDTTPPDLTGPPTDASPPSPTDFEEQARAWLTAHVDATDRAPRRRGADLVAYERDLQARIHDAGFGVGITRPVEQGGRGLGEEHRQAWERATAGFATPYATYAVSHGMCGPIIDLLGTEDQKERFLPRLWRGDDLWCQLFSEPAAGSDVAGLRSRA
ncbi:acyl-CoA dehydrogenase family protein [Brevibacterium litoralis]|uniref:acyl-CoA dehydrogenase family protein n=1 Tax=Brevibacterium litoralis TaxID=3138935 RepID=UPI0032EE04CA